MNYRYSWLIYSVVLTIVVLGFWVSYKDHQQILAAISIVGWQGMLFLCLFSSFNYLLRYLRWNYLLAALGDRVRPKESLLCYLSGFAFTTSPAKSGEIIRCYYFSRRHGVAYSHTLSGLITERIMDAFATILIGTLAIYTFGNVRWVGGIFTLSILVASFLISHQKLLLRLAEVFRFTKVGIVQQFLDFIPVLLERSNRLLTPRIFTGGLIVGLIAWSAEAMAFAWLVQTLGGAGSILLYMSIFCIAIVAGALTFVPGGLGGTEVVLYLLIVATGLGEAEALAATILIRLATLWYAVALGLIAVLWMELVDGEAPTRQT